MHPRNISIRSYTYTLPEGKIALHPSNKRDDSKLLIYRHGNISEDRFSNICKQLPESSMLVFNNTRVINARLLFKKPGGSTVEIFCLEPAEKVVNHEISISQKEHSSWKCLIGNAAKWKEEQLEKIVHIEGVDILLIARKVKVEKSFIVDFKWTPGYFTFGEILKATGQVPLPPYIKRIPIDEDEERYQTVFARWPGSVAAPTAGLHFSNDTISSLTEKNISQVYVTLHVGAGTFKPVTSDTMDEHDMHHEYIRVHVDAIKQLSDNENIIAVGTTSLRTLETLYWLGAKILLNENIKELQLLQWEVYEEPLKDATISKKKALDALAAWLTRQKQDFLFCHTQILIAPGYSFQIAKGLVTNFHQPQSTLLLLVAAAIGDEWKKMYDYALANDFRFLSYGDANLIFMDGS